jgi:hypothetical protein
MTTITDHLHHPHVKIAACAVFILFLAYAGWTFVTITYDLPSHPAKGGSNLSHDRSSLEAPVTRAINGH